MNPSKRLRRRVNIALLSTLLGLTSFGSVGSALAASASSPDIDLRIGYQKSSTLIVVLKTQGKLEKALAPLGVHLTWNEFASGLPLIEALNANAIDFSADVADTVPVFAQAAKADFVYVAQEAPSPSAQAIVVHRDGSIHTLADLKGKRIAVAKAAGAHYLLLAALQHVGLTTKDVQISYLAPADGRAAFETGSVDAWVTWDPYLASVEKQPDLQVLADGQGLASYQRYYLASKPFATAHPAVIRILFEQLAEAGKWVKANPQEAARILAPLWGLDAAGVERANSRRSYEVRPVLSQNFGEQQAIADTFFRAGLLPALVETRRVPLWSIDTGAAPRVATGG